MGFVVKLLMVIAAFVVGSAMIKYREKLVRMVGKNYYAEKYLGAGGSYTFWVLLGTIVIVGTVIYVLK
ncbi:MAG: hypothetical protein Q7S37_04060 [bacterium]|nr:hypothetical protein [bacterium]